MEVKMAEPKPTTMQVVLHSGRDLIKTEWIGRSDPYIKVSLDHTESKTTSAKKGSHPGWEETLSFTYSGESNLSFEVWDKELFRDHYMGIHNLPLQQILDSPARRFEGELPLSHGKGDAAGFLKVTVDFWPKKPEPAASADQEKNAKPAFPATAPASPHPVQQPPPIVPPPCQPPVAVYAAPPPAYYPAAPCPSPYYPAAPCPSPYASPPPYYPPPYYPPPHASQAAPAPSSTVIVVNPTPYAQLQPQPPRYY